MIRLNRSKHHLILLLGLLNATCTLRAAESELPEVEVTIVRGSQYEICQDYAAILAKQRVNTTFTLTGSSYCGVAIPLENPDYALTEWENMEPTQNMELVKTMYYWSNFNRSVGTELYDRQITDRSKIDEEILALFWPKAEAQVLAFIQAGRVELQHSRFDIDFDGVDEDVYRMSPIVRLGGALPPQEQDPHPLDVRDACDDYGLPGATKQYVYYTPVSELPHGDYAFFMETNNGIQMNGFFSWKGRIYWDYRAANIFEPYGGVNPRAVQICGITSKSIQGNEQ